MHSKELIRGTLRTIILRLLDEHGRMYGYEITQKVKELSGEQMVLTEAALYPALHKLEGEGFLTSETILVGKRKRKYYTLTPQGSKAAVEKLAEFQSFIHIMKAVLGLKVT